MRFIHKITNIDYQTSQAYIHSQQSLNKFIQNVSKVLFIKIQCKNQIDIVKGYSQLTLTISNKENRIYIRRLFRLALFAFNQIV